MAKIAARNTDQEDRPRCHAAVRTLAVHEGSTSIASTCAHFLYAVCNIFACYFFFNPQTKTISYTARHQNMLCETVLCPPLSHPARRSCGETTSRAPGCWRHAAVTPRSYDAPEPPQRRVVSPLSHTSVTCHRLVQLMYGMLMYE